MTTMTATPDLDKDELTYKFPIKTSTHPYNVYYIARSINGGTFQTIGTVRQTQQADWGHSASWWAQTTDESVKASGTTRKAAVSSLEFRLQGSEYADRKRAEYLAEQAERQRLVQEELEARRARVRALYSDLPLLGVFGGYITIDQLLKDADSFGTRSYTPEQVIELLEFLAKP